MKILCKKNNFNCFKKVKKVLLCCLIMLFAIITLCSGYLGVTVGAVENINFMDNNNVEATFLKDLPSVKINQNLLNNDNKLNETLASYTVSPTKTIVKNLYSSTTGSKLGNATLVYKTQIIGGRPQFLYSTVKLGWNITASGWRLMGNPVIDYSNDCIKVNFSLNKYGILNDSAHVYFYP